MDLAPTPPDSSFGLLADAMCDGVRWLETRMEALGEQGPVAIEFMRDAATKLRVQLAPEKMAPDSTIPESVRIRRVRHDFRNMIAAVVGFSELLMLEDDVADDVKERLLALKKDSREFCDRLDDVRDSAA